MPLNSYPAQAQSACHRTLWLSCCSLMPAAVCSPTGYPSQPSRGCCLSLLPLLSQGFDVAKKALLEFLDKFKTDVDPADREVCGQQQALYMGIPGRMRGWGYGGAMDLAFVTEALSYALLWLHIHVNVRRQGLAATVSAVHTWLQLSCCHKCLQVASTHVPSC